MKQTENYRGYFISTLCDEGSSETRLFVKRGFGIAPDAKTAELKAASEFNELRCSSNYSSDEIVLSRYSQLDPRTVNIDFISNRTYNFSPQKRYFWTSVRDLLRNEDFFVPASFVYLPFEAPGQDEDINIQTSIGLASHPASTECLRKAVLEILERHYFLQAWNGHVRVFRLRRETSEPNVTLFWIDNPCDVNVVLAVLGSDSFPFYSLGVSANTDLDASIQAAITESILVDYCNEKLLSKIRVQGPNFSFKSFQSHGPFFYAFYEEYRRFLRDWLEQFPERDIERHPHCLSLKQCANALGSIFVKSLCPSIPTSGEQTTLRAFIPNAVTHFFHSSRLNRFLPPL